MSLDTPTPTAQAIGEVAETITRRRGYTLADFDAICAGGHLPNAEPVDAGAMLNSIAAHRFVERHGQGLHPGTPYKSWAHYFLIDGQGGGLTGEGYAVIYSSEWDPATRRNVGGKAYRFAICKHEKVAGAGANPQRGWHPGHCSKCGLDMTVDSGD